MKHLPTRRHRVRQVPAIRHPAPATWWISTRPTQARRIGWRTMHRSASRAWFERLKNRPTDPSVRRSMRCAMTLTTSRRETSRNCNQFYGWNSPPSSISITLPWTNESLLRGSAKKKEMCLACRLMHWCDAINKSPAKTHRLCHSSFRAFCESSWAAVLRRKAFYALRVISRR